MTSAAFVVEGRIVVVHGPASAMPRVHADGVRLWRLLGCLSIEAFRLARDRERLIDEARD